MISYKKISIGTTRSGKGECIHLRFVGNSGNYHNIIIDTGPASTSGAFRELVSKIISTEEVLDMLIITHYDEDHIGGILRVGDPGFQNIYFNAYNGEEQTGNLTATQNQQLFHLLPRVKIHSSVLKGDIIELDGAKIIIHAPTENMLLKAMQKMKEVDAQLANEHDWQYSLVELMNRSYSGTDSSPSNRSSIVFTFEYDSCRFLFCGDAWSENIPGGEYDLVKLPHHGSIRNISEELLSRIKTDSFMICADGTSHPNKQTIAKLLQKYEKITIYGNYSWWMDNFLKMEDMKFIQDKQLSFKTI